jgi:hypothetical protein
MGHRSNGENVPMTTTLWIALTVAVLCGLVYVLRVRNAYVESRELDKKIDFAKVRKWDEEKDAD